MSQPVEVIVNSWNRNIIPWWLLLPQGVSGAIKKKAGLKPFIEVGKFGLIPLGPVNTNLFTSVACEACLLRREEHGLVIPNKR